MGYAQDLLNEIEYEELLIEREKDWLMEKEVEESLMIAFDQEINKTLKYNRSVQRLIDISR